MEEKKQDAKPWHITTIDTPKKFIPTTIVDNHDKLQILKILRRPIKPRIYTCTQSQLTTHILGMGEYIDRAVEPYSFILNSLI